MDAIIKQAIEFRSRDNQKCIEFLIKKLEEHPELRFEQLINNLDRQQDYFYEEPGETLKRWKDYDS